VDRNLCNVILLDLRTDVQLQKKRNFRNYS